MRAIWSGSIGFGLVNIPVKLFSASQSSTLDLDMLDRRDHSRIRFRRINENTEKEVDWDEYSRDLMKIIKAKAAGKRPSIRKINVPKTKSDDLLKQLKASLKPGKKAS